MSNDAQIQADAEKAKGNTAYKARDFPTAITHYEAAFALHPNPVYLNNLAAVHFEQGEWDTCIATCEKAIEAGREARADYKVIAKSFARMGSAYLKKEDYVLGIKNLEKSLTEHRTPDTLAKLKEAEKTKAEKEKSAYLDPALADKAREEGNAAFKGGDFATSVRHYSEAIKRNPSDPKALTNRAAAYSKLLALPEALKDAETAITVDPTYIKAHIRKSLTLLAMKDPKKALDAIQVAEARDSEAGNKSSREIRAQMEKCLMAEFGETDGMSDEEKAQRAMRDPEIQGIMADPVMRSILEQAQNDPKALQSHMQNPMIREKIMKLVRSGIIRTG